MAIINKVTKLRAASALTEEEIQAHIDQQNNDGWYIICIDNISGWYRIFWAKTIVE